MIVSKRSRVTPANPGRVVYGGNQSQLSREYVGAIRQVTSLSTLGLNLQLAVYEIKGVALGAACTPDGCAPKCIFLPIPMPPPNRYAADVNRFIPAGHELTGTDWRTIMQLQSEMGRQNSTLNWSIQGRLHFDRERAVHRLGPAVISLLARLMLDMDLLWQAPLPAGPKIFAANHPTTVDPFLLLKLAPEDMRILVTGGAFTVPLFGRYLQHVGHIPVIKGQGQKALKEASRQLASGRSIGIFPEGALSPIEGGLGHPRSGVARLALSSGLPIIPVGIHLQQERIKYVAAKIDGQPSLGRFYLSGPYAMTIGKPMHFDGRADDWEQVCSVADDVMQRISQLGLESAKRIDSSQGEIPALAASLTSGRISLPSSG